ncbi:UbiH/UbiF/VisC/COQ6 family ubiquinone biosynthesis hydroxylase [Oceanibacterium hippocampi]|uniref:2-octaprenyl-6-methoxyphenol hydroxylase n=1 Tax=Oceanibacterium hippocampi TaxID=745714 RepID=A0A1Y5RFK6_9PROT|nr:UbiH/UbiF/VisC/COQ6 family ubiquinone biosynthesis hydroxylase [Oceanibacterium hippocampi]SLN16009.1 2-octaprenyl-6-methoxyphenol hydroxylase [Oceanibacterium hippocampi]
MSNGTSRQSSAVVAEPDADIVIAGGGLVGMSLAIALADAGLRVVLVDRDPEARHVAPEFDGRASAIAFATWRLLEAIGVWRHVRDAEPIRDIRVTDGESPLFLHYDNRELGEGPFGHMVENRWLREALFRRAEELPSLRQFRPAELVDTVRDDDGVRARLDEGRTVTARLVVAAEGRNSALREAAGIPVSGWSYDQVGIVCTVRHELSHGGVAQERFLPAGPFAILPLSGNRSSLVWTEKAALAPAIMALDDAAFFDEMAARFGDYLGDLEIVGPRWSYPLGLQNAARYIDRRLALVGDAAHVMHPIAGQGLNLGLRDVAALAECLVDARRLGLDIGRPEVLEDYQRWRRTDAMVLLAVTDSLNRLFSNDVAPLRVARALGLAGVNRLPPLKRFFMRHARGTVGKLPRLLAGAPL